MVNLLTNQTALTLPGPATEPVRHKDYQARGHRADALRAWNARQFIAWDGEGTKVNEPVELSQKGHVFGYYWDDERELFLQYERKPQPYVLLANSVGGQIKAPPPNGLSTTACLELLLETRRQYPESVFIGFGFNYDINQILKDVPIPFLESLVKNNWTVHQGGGTSYHIQWFPRKYFIVTNKRQGVTRSAILYDVLGFFNKTFVNVCKDYLGEDDPDLDMVQQGKDKREAFDWEELDDFIIPYNALELKMLVRVMDLLRKDLHTVGVMPSKWHGPGAVANETMAKFSVPISREIPLEVQVASQFAYAGGWFEAFGMGRHPDFVYEADIHSAYPAAALHVPDLSDGSWEHVTSFEPNTFGVWHLSYKSPAGRNDIGPQPLFCRSKNGSISHPTEVQGWYWTPEASLLSACVEEGWVYRPRTDARPFAFVEDYYVQRRLLKMQGNPAERAIKTILASLYGKLAQTIGGKDGPPRWHQLEAAGYITSYTRAKIWQAIRANPGAIIAVETDAVFSTEPLDLPYSDALGDWELKKFAEIVYLQSGYYYSTDLDGSVDCRKRGMDTDRNTRQPLGLPYETVIDHLQNNTGRGSLPTIAMIGNTTRFIGLGLALKTQAVWRSWERKPRLIVLDSDARRNKRFHRSKDCSVCAADESMYQRLHPTMIGGYSGHSFARDLPWRKVTGCPCATCKTNVTDAGVSNDETYEMDGTWIEEGKEIDRFQ
jgi:hypothetical protein